MKARTEVNNHHHEKFHNLFMKDQVWTAPEIWSWQVKQIEMTAFQEAMLERSLAEYCMTEDAAPDEVAVLIAYVAVMAGECLEMIDNLSEDVIHKDLMVGITSVPLFWMRLTFS